jgi:hypothetical protein
VQVTLLRHVCSGVDVLSARTAELFSRVSEIALTRLTQRAFDRWMSRLDGGRSG